MRHVTTHMAGDHTRSPEFLAAKADARAAAQCALLRPIRSYEELRAAIDNRRKMLGMTMLELDERSGCSTGYSAKLIAGLKHFGPGSFEWITGALGIDLIIIERRRD
jgi:hypothetical protein